jgi:F-type H+-transporting ATPase subunit b
VEGHAASIKDLLYPTINFALFAWLLVRFLKEPIREFFRARAERIRAEIATGDRARQEAQDLRSRMARDLAELPATIERLKADVRATAERERDQMLVQARQAADRIRADAKVIAEQEVGTARRTLRADTVEEAVRLATGLVRRAMGASDQDRLVQTFVEAAGSAS